MKNKLLILTFLVLSFSSMNAQVKNIKYIPEQYEEHRIDTTLDSKLNLKVIIIRKTLMDKSVTYTYTIENDLTETQYYRDYSSEIIVYKADSILFRRTLVKNDFEQIGDDEFMNKAITQNTWIQEYDRKNKTIKISHVIGVPETDWNYHFTLFIDKKGKFHSELDEIE
jgi:hypothetical protein